MSASDHYIIRREIARGGMGAVLEATDQALDREVAMKVMLEAGEQDLVARQRFLREALVLARLSHPNIVPIHEMGRDEQGRRFYTMKLVKGRTLQAILTALKQGDAATTQHYTLDRLLTIYRKVCDAVSFAHHQRIIHRDLKPDNIMVGEFGEVLVMDWGLAKHLDDQQHARSEAERVQSIEGFNELSDAELAAGAGNLTLEGSVMGSPQYMPPEQAEGRLAEIGPHSDIYSLGAVLYAILTLRPPVEGKNVSDVLAKVRSGIITPPSTYNTVPTRPARPSGEAGDARLLAGLPHCPDGKVPASLSAVTMRAMALQPAGRYADVAALLADIEAYQGGFATSAEDISAFGQFMLLVKRNQGAAIAVAAGLVVVAVLTAVFVRGMQVKEHEALRAASEAITEKEKALKAKDAARSASALAQIALAEAAFRSGDLPAMVQALDACPPDKRDPHWTYLSNKRDGSIGALRVPGFEKFGPFAAVPGKPGQFALATGNGDIGFVEAGTGRVLHTFKVVRRGLRELVFSGDGQTFAIRVGTTVELFDVASGALRKTLPLTDDQVHEIALSQDAGLLAVISDARGLRRPSYQLSLIETASGNVRWQKRAPHFGSVLIHPDGTRVTAVSGGAARFCWIFDSADGREVVRHPVYAMCQALSPDGRTLAVGSQEGVVLLFNTATGAIFQRGKLHNSQVRAMTWTADGHLLTMGDEGKFHDNRWILRLWDPDALALRATFAGLTPGALPQWVFNPASGHLLTHESPPRLWRIPAGRELAKFSHISEQAWGGAFVADTMLVARRGYELARYDLSTPGKATELPNSAFTDARLVAVHPATRTFAVSPASAKVSAQLRIFAPGGNGIVEKLTRPLPAAAAYLALKADASRAVATLRNGALEVASTTKAAEPPLQIPGKFQFADFAGSQGRLVAVTPGTVKADNVEFHLHQLDGTTGKLLATATNRFHVQSLAVSPNGKLVALSGSDRAVHLFDADTLREQPGFRAHDNDVGVVTFHPTQPILATASVDGSVKLWDHRSGKLLDYFLGLAGNPVVLSFSPNGKLLMVDGQERTTRIYDVSSVKAE